MQPPRIRRWSSECKQIWDSTEHLSLVAGISRSEREERRVMGIRSMRELAVAGGVVADLQAGTFRISGAGAPANRLPRYSGRLVEVLPLQLGRGSERCDSQIRGDMLLDMEGDPLYEGAASKTSRHRS